MTTAEPNPFRFSGLNARKPRRGGQYVCAPDDKREKHALKGPYIQSPQVP